MEYLWQYYLLVGTIFLQGILFCSKKRKKFFYLFTFLILFVLAGFRSWDIGNDTLTYVHAFMKSIDYPFLTFASHMEKGYLIFNYVLSLISSNPQAILIVNAIIIVGAAISFVRKYSLTPFLSILLFTILMFGNSLNIMRQFLAISIIVVYGLKYVEERRFFPFFLVCLLAATFHRSAIICLAMYYFYNLKLNYKYILWGACLSVVAFFLLRPIIDVCIYIIGHYRGYRGTILFGNETKVASVIKTMVNLSISLFCLFTYKYVYHKKNSRIQERLPAAFMVFCSLFASLLSFLSIRGTLLGRLVIYFSYFNIVSIPFFLRCYSANARRVLTYVILLCFLLYDNVVFIYRPNWNRVLPYEFCFK